MRSSKKTGTKWDEEGFAEMVLKALDFPCGRGRWERGPGDWVALLRRHLVILLCASVSL